MPLTLVPVKGRGEGKGKGSMKNDDDSFNSRARKMGGGRKKGVLKNFRG